MILKPGDAFWLSGTGNANNPGNRHLFVCLAASPAGKTTEYLLVPACTRTTKSDGTCPLVATDHPDLKHDSYAAYYQMRLMGQKALDVAVFGNQVKAAAPVTSPVLKRLRDGVLVSDEATPANQAFYKAHGIPK